MKFDDYVPDNFTLQWHITDTCNFRCSHCYQDNYSSRGETLENWKEILHQLLALVSIWRTKNPGIKIHINVTGGEPFTHPDFFSLMELFHANKKKFSYGILSNGSLLNSEKSNRLKSLEPGFVQVSLEGGKKANDKIRGNGSFEKIRTGIRNLKKNNIKTLISFTASNENFLEFKKVAALGRKWKVDQVWSDRFLPINIENKKNQGSLSPDEARIFFESMEKEKHRKSFFNKNVEISMNRALQFLCGGDRIYNCTAGTGLLTVMPDGSVFPCRRLPLHIGNIFENNLKDIYYGNSFLHDQLSKEVSECSFCNFSKKCKGGLRCLSYIVNKDPFTKDPGCWK